MKHTPKNLFPIASDAEYIGVLFDSESEEDRESLCRELEPVETAAIPLYAGATLRLVSEALFLSQMTESRAKSRSAFRTRDDFTGRQSFDEMLSRRACENLVDDMQQHGLLPRTFNPYGNPDLLETLTVLAGETWGADHSRLSTAWRSIRELRDAGEACAAIVAEEHSVGAAAAVSRFRAVAQLYTGYFMHHISETPMKGKRSNTDQRDRHIFVRVVFPAPDSPDSEADEVLFGDIEAYYYVENGLLEAEERIRNIFERDFVGDEYHVVAFMAPDGRYYENSASYIYISPGE